MLRHQHGDREVDRGTAPDHRALAPATPSRTYLCSGFFRLRKWYRPGRHRIFALSLLLISLLLLSLGAFVSMTGKKKPERNPPLMDGGALSATLVPPRKDCWMFQHMVKSGGSTVRVMLLAWAKQEQVQHYRYVDFMWLQGDPYANKLVDRNLTFVLGEYTECLRPYGGNGGCKWFTMFRHPVSRLVSAFFFCKPRGRGSETHDPLCGHEAIDMRTADIVDFAEHWGNYGLRQYVIPYMSQDVINSSPAARECNQRIDKSSGLKCTAWHLVKLHLQDIASSSTPDTDGNDRPLDEEGMYPYLEAARARLSNDYEAVGLLEDFNTSLSLFDKALDMPRFSWQDSYGKLGTVNSARSGQEGTKRELLAQAWTNLAVRRYIALDLLLYDHAVAVHATQAAKHGL